MSAPALTSSRHRVRRRASPSTSGQVLTRMCRGGFAPRNRPHPRDAISPEAIASPYAPTYAAISQARRIAPRIAIATPSAATAPASAGTASSSPWAAGCVGNSSEGMLTMESYLAAPRHPPPPALGALGSKATGLTGDFGDSILSIKVGRSDEVHHKPRTAGVS